MNADPMVAGDTAEFVRRVQNVSWAVAFLFVLPRVPRMNAEMMDVEGFVEVVVVDCCVFWVLA